MFHLQFAGYDDLRYLVQEKDSYIAQLNHRVLIVLKEREDAVKQLKETSHQLLSIKSSHKITGASYYCN